MSSQITGMRFKKGSDGVVDALLVSFNCNKHSVESSERRALVEELPGSDWPVVMYMEDYLDFELV